MSSGNPPSLPKNAGQRKKLFPHLHPPALLLYGDNLVVLVVALCAFRAHRCVILLAEHRQGLVVLSAQVAGIEDCWICEAVSLQRWISLVRHEVNLTVRRLTHQTRLNRRRLVPVADVTGHVFTV